MERTAPTTGNSERDHREALEQVQMELRAARATLSTAADDAARARTALEEALAEATVKRDEAAARLAALHEEKQELARRLDELAPRLAAKRAEDAVLARGARLRDKYVDWNPNDRQYQVGSPSSRPQGDVKGFLIVAVFVLILLFALLK